MGTSRMPVPQLAKKISTSIALLLTVSVAIAYGVWRYLEAKIARDAHAPQLARIRESATDFPFRTLDGVPRHLAESKGKVVFLDLWGTWCIQCVAEMPTVQALYEHYRHDPDVTFLIVSRLDSADSVRRYAHLNHYDLPFYTTDDADVPSSMQLNQFPATFIYAPDGTVVTKHTGAADWSAPSVISFIDELKKK